MRSGPAQGPWASSRVLCGTSEAAWSPALCIGALDCCRTLLLAWSPGVCGSVEALGSRAHARFLGWMEGTRSRGPSPWTSGRAQQVSSREVVVGMAGMLADEVEPPAWFLVGSRGSQGLGK